MPSEPWWLVVKVLGYREDLSWSGWKIWNWHASVFWNPMEPESLNSSLKFEESDMTTTAEAMRKKMKWKWCRVTSPKLVLSTTRYCCFWLPSFFLLQDRFCGEVVERPLACHWMSKPLPPGMAINLWNAFVKIYKLKCFGDELQEHNWSKAWDFLFWNSLNDLSFAAGHLAWRLKPSNNE